jgi:hypothetical protein
MNCRSLNTELPSKSRFLNVASYTNKSFDLDGHLLEILWKPFYKKMLENLEAEKEDLSPSFECINTL